MKGADMSETTVVLIHGAFADAPAITVPTITLEGDANGAPTSYTAKFTGPYTHRTIEGGIGHNLPQETPDAFADAVVQVSGMT
jgi:pimeloyl-ACP methyl ester carboxylesterase